MSVHVEDLRAMAAREEARHRALEDDPGVQAAQAEYVRKLDAYEAARRDLEEVSVRLAGETRRVLTGR